MAIPLLAGVCLVKNNKVLIVQQKDNNKWGPPGGHGNEKETPQETALREVKEETGLDVKITGVVQSALASSSQREVIVVLYKGELTKSKKVLIDDNEIKDFYWVTLEEIKNDKFILRDPILKPLLIKSITKKASPKDSFIVVNLED